VLGPLPDAGLDRLPRAEAVADAQGVFNVLFRGVARAQDSRHATLGVLGVGIGQLAFRHQNHATVGAGAQRKVQSGQART